MRKVQTKQEKAQKEANRQKSQAQKQQKTWGIGIAVISVLLVLSMVITSFRF